MGFFGRRVFRKKRRGSDDDEGDADDGGAAVPAGKRRSSGGGGAQRGHDVGRVEIFNVPVSMHYVSPSAPLPPRGAPTASSPLATSSLWNTTRKPEAPSHPSVHLTFPTRWFCLASL